MILGIDPGLDGALASLHGSAVCVYDTPTLKGVKRDYDLRTMSERLAELCADGVKMAILERVHAMPGQGVSSMFNMGRGYGIWLGLLAAHRVPYELVLPQRWKKVMLPDMDRSSKDSSRLRAMQLFPDCAAQLTRKKDHNRAEALLIAAYGQRLVGGHTAV